MTIDRTRLEKLQSERSTRHARYLALLQQAERARASVDTIDAQITAQLAHSIAAVQRDGLSRAEKRVLRATTPTRVDELRLDRARAADRLAHVERERDAAGVSWGSLARLVERCENFLQSVPHVMLGDRQNSRHQTHGIRANPDERLAGQIE